MPQGASAIEQLTGPGGGERVAFTDYFGQPGFVVFGIQERTPKVQVKLTLNYPAEKIRRNDFQRFKQGYELDSLMFRFGADLDASSPAMINKLGHWGYITGDFAGCFCAYSPFWLRR